MAERSKSKTALQKATSEARVHIIPPRAIKVPLANLPQPNGYSCGAAALMAVCNYFGKGPKTIQRYEELLKSNRHDGTSYTRMVRLAKKLKLHASAKQNMTQADLEEYLFRGIPVICSIQAYCPPKDYAKNDSGHFVVAIGYDDDNFYFMDPSIPAWHLRRGFIPRAMLDARWHDNEGTVRNPEVLTHLGLVIHDSAPRAFTARAWSIH